MASSNFNSFIDRETNGYGHIMPFYGQVQTAVSSTVFGSAPACTYVPMKLKTLPTLPSGVDYYLPTQCEIATNSARTIMLGMFYDLGSIDISGASGTFTAGSSMPTRTEGNASTNTFSSVICAVETQLNATPGTLSITYTDQDGNSGTSSGLALTGSALVNSCSVMPFASGDFGARTVTGSSRSGGTTPTGVIRFYGFYPLVCTVLHGTVGSVIDLLNDRIEYHKLGANDSIGMLVFSNTVGGFYGSLNVIGMAN